MKPEINAAGAMRIRAIEFVLSWPEPDPKCFGIWLAGLCDELAGKLPADCGNGKWIREYSV
jgi:hypothetical protein